MIWFVKKPYDIVSKATLGGKAYKIETISISRPYK